MVILILKYFETKGLVIVMSIEGLLQILRISKFEKIKGELWEFHRLFDFYPNWKNGAEYDDDSQEKADEQDLLEKFINDFIGNVEDNLF